MDLGNVVREVSALFSQTIDRRIDVTCSIADDLLPAFVDPNQVHQVLMNLCVNARDAIMESLETVEKSGGRPLTGYWIYTRAENVLVDDDYCRIFPYARKGRYIRLSIGDNGAGMDEATQRRVFEPFFTTKKMGRGTGLGLSTVYGIIKQHNGWINLESRAGKGTTFCAYFPEATGLPEEAPALPEPPASGRGKETVLFADDEELIRDLGRQVMEMYGYTVFLAEDGIAGDRSFPVEPGGDRPGGARPHDAPAVRDGGLSRDPENRPGRKDHPLQRQPPDRAGPRNDVPSEAVSRRHAGEGRSLRPRRPPAGLKILGTS